jgi:hypothetical protein
MSFAFIIRCYTSTARSLRHWLWKWGPPSTEWGTRMWRISRRTVTSSRPILYIWRRIGTPLYTRQLSLFFVRLDVRCWGREDRGLFQGLRCSVYLLRAVRPPTVFPHRGRTIAEKSLFENRLSDKLSTRHLEVLRRLKKNATVVGSPDETHGRRHLLGDRFWNMYDMTSVCLGIGVLHSQHPHPVGN